MTNLFTTLLFINFVMPFLIVLYILWKINNNDNDKGY